MNVNSKIFLDVRINRITRILVLRENDIKEPGTVVEKSEYYFQLFYFHKVNMHFLFSVLETFNITSDGYIDFKFRDNLQAPIEVDYLPELIMQKKCSGSFFIELVLNEPPLSFRMEVRFCFLFSFCDEHNLFYVFPSFHLEYQELYRKQISRWKNI